MELQPLELLSPNDDSPLEADGDDATYSLFSKLGHHPALLIAPALIIGILVHSYFQSPPITRTLHERAAVPSSREIVIDSEASSLSAGDQCVSLAIGLDRNATNIASVRFFLSLFASSDAPFRKFECPAASADFSRGFVLFRSYDINFTKAQAQIALPRSLHPFNFSVIWSFGSATWPRVALRYRGCAFLSILPMLHAYLGRIVDRGFAPLQLPQKLTFGLILVALFSNCPFLSPFWPDFTLKSRVAHSIIEKVCLALKMLYSFVLLELFVKIESGKAVVAWPLVLCLAAAAFWVFEAVRIRDGGVVHLFPESGIDPGLGIGSVVIFAVYIGLFFVYAAITDARVSRSKGKRWKFYLVVHGVVFAIVFLLGSIRFFGLAFGKTAMFEAMRIAVGAVYVNIMAFGFSEVDGARLSLPPPDADRLGSDPLGLEEGDKAAFEGGAD
jgi:hypothetical protein